MTCKWRPCLPGSGVRSTHPRAKKSGGRSHGFEHDEGDGIGGGGGGCGDTMTGGGGAQIDIGLAAMERSCGRGGGGEAW